MTRDETELLERLVAAWNGRDLESFMALVHPHVVYVNAPAAVEPGTRAGHSALADVVRKQWEGLGPDARQDVERAHRVGDSVVTETRLTRRLPGSTARIENAVALRWTFEGGLLIRLEVLGGGSRFREALEGAGIHVD